jgi:uncharacterized membrane protein
MSRSIRYDSCGGDVHDFLLFAGAFLASAVEMVEALTIVLAVGITRGWRSALWGVATALIALVLIIGVLGSALTDIPIDSLRVVVGAVLLIFGLQWLRKAILRAGGLKALHDEDAIFRAEVAALEHADGTARHDWYSFTVSFKGVFLEGLEVAFIVVTFGSTQGNVGLAAIGAGAALVVVLVAGIVAHAPLARVPENSLKFAVGVMLSAFGIFWAAEGAGVVWPGGETAIFGLIAFVLAVSIGLVALARSSSPTLPASPPNR